MYSALIYNNSLKSQAFACTYSETFRCFNSPKWADNQLIQSYIHWSTIGSCVVDSVNGYSDVEHQLRWIETKCIVTIDTVVMVTV